VIWLLIHPLCSREKGVEYDTVFLIDKVLLLRDTLMWSQKYYLLVLQDYIVEGGE